MPLKPPTTINAYRVLTNQSFTVIAKNFKERISHGCDHWPSQMVQRKKSMRMSSSYAHY